MFSIQGLDFDRSVCMAAICCSVTILAVPTNEQKSTFANFQIDISKTEAAVRVYIERQTDMA